MANRQLHRSFMWRFHFLSTCQPPNQGDSGGSWTSPGTKTLAWDHMYAVTSDSHAAHVASAEERATFGMLLSSPEEKPSIKATKRRVLGTSSPKQGRNNYVTGGLPCVTPDRFNHVIRLMVRAAT